MDVLIQNMFIELNKAMNYNKGMYVEDVIKTVLQLTQPTLREDRRVKLHNSDLYNALVKYNKVKGL
jgi:hypothetical protein